MKKTFFAMTVISILSFLMLTSISAVAQQSKLKTRIGIFDSRAVAIAYTRSEQFMKQLNSMRAELKKAKDEGNEKRAKELEKQGPGLQELLHLQGFSTGSVRNIMERIKNKLPQIARENNVSLIISKWEPAYTDRSLQLVDITMKLVNLFNPDEQTLKTITEMQKQQPIPMEKLVMGTEK